MTKLFEPTQFGPLKVANRIVVAPMCMYSSVNGEAQPWHKQHIGMLSQSGAGLVIIEASAVSPEGRITYADMGIWNDATAARLKEVVSEVKRYSSTPLAIQLGHAGRKASCARPWDGGHHLAPDDANGWQTIAPSALPFAEGDPLPEAMSAERIQSLVEQFTSAAKRAVDAGFDGIELHAAHGYLLHQFLSPLSNERTDIYGGSLENRMRLPLEVFDAVKAAIPDDIMLGIRISASDWAEGGWDIDQSIALARELDKRGCDYIHVSSGGLTEKQQINVGPNYQVPFADAIKREVEMPVIAVGLITEAEQAEAIVHEGRADAVALARGILYDPRWAWHAAAKLGATAKAAPQYLRCQPHTLKSLLERDQLD